MAGYEFLCVVSAGNFHSGAGYILLRSAGYAGRLVPYAAVASLEGNPADCGERHSGNAGPVASGVWRGLVAGEFYRREHCAACGGTAVCGGVLSFLLPTPDRKENLIKMGKGQNAFPNFFIWLSAAPEGVQSPRRPFRSAPPSACGSHRPEQIPPQLARPETAGSRRPAHR